MTALEAIKILKTDMGCYECTVGCSNPYRCANDACPFREAIHLAVERLSIDVLPKMINTEPQTEMEKSGSRAVRTARCLNCHNAKACKENDWKVCRYDPWKLTAVENEPQTEDKILREQCRAFMGIVEQTERSEE